MKKTNNSALYNGERKNQVVGNCLLIHGGGLCATSKDYLFTLADALMAMPEIGEVFVGLYSFECFFNPEEWILPWSEFREEIKDAPGGAFGTSRGVIVEAPETVEKIIAACRARNITKWFIAGGDGSSRAATEVAPMLAEAGIQVIFPQILTLDGVEGGIPLGVLPAVEKDWEVIEDVVATSAMTRNNFHYCPIIFKIMGRNRNDPLAMLLKKVDKAEFIGGIARAEIEVFALPAGLENPTECVDNLVKKVSALGDRRVVVLLSEGFELPVKQVLKSIETIKYTAHGKEYFIKARSQEPGYLQQMSAFSDDSELVEKIVQDSIPVIKQGIALGDPFTVVRESLDNTPYLGPIYYYAERNPKHNQVPTLVPKLQTLLEKYTP